MDELDDISTTTIINKTKAHFARFGVPRICHTDNGPQYTSEEYAKFAAHYGFKHTTSSPYHSQGNGKAEAAVKVSESMLKKSDDLQTALLNHRNTSPKGHSYSPAQRMLNRRTRTTLPTPDHLLEPSTIHTDTVIEEIKTKRSTSKTYYDKSAGNAHDTVHIGQFVYAQPPPRQHGKPWTYGRITEQRHPRSYTIKTPHSTIRRNRVHIRRAAPPLHTTTTLPPAVPATMRNPIQQHLSQRSTPNMSTTQHHQLSQPPSGSAQNNPTHINPTAAIQETTNIPTDKPAQPQTRDTRTLTETVTTPTLTNTQESPQEIQPEVRTRTRRIKQPARFQDYEMTSP